MGDCHMQKFHLIRMCHTPLDPGRKTPHKERPLYRRPPTCGGGRSQITWTHSEKKSVSRVDQFVLRCKAFCVLFFMQKGPVSCLRASSSGLLSPSLALLLHVSHGFGCAWWCFSLCFSVSVLLRPSPLRQILCLLVLYSPKKTPMLSKKVSRDMRWGLPFIASSSINVWRLAQSQLSCIKMLLVAF